MLLSWDMDKKACTYSIGQDSTRLGNGIYDRFNDFFTLSVILIGIALMVWGEDLPTVVAGSLWGGKGKLLGLSNEMQIYHTQFLPTMNLRSNKFLNGKSDDNNRLNWREI